MAPAARGGGKRNLRAGPGDFLALAGRLSSRRDPPSREALAPLVTAALEALEGEDPLLRPRNSSGRPGGLLDLPDLPIVILPDLHTRAGFLAAALAWRLPLGVGARDADGGRIEPGERPRAAKARTSFGVRPLADLLVSGEAILLCLGDVFHSEGRDAPQRWARAEREYGYGWSLPSPAMDEEMGRALACVELILRAKAAFPGTFHYLKGNHDNVVNEEGNGDHPFYKFAEEGAMAASWFAARYGRDLQDAYRAFELSLPLAARGSRFVASHAEPAFVLGPEDIIEARNRPEVAEALTWTGNGEALPGSVSASLELLLGPRASGARWFGGHRPVPGAYSLRADGLYVQFHNPLKQGLVLLLPGEPPDPDRVVRTI